MSQELATAAVEGSTDTEFKGQVHLSQLGHRWLECCPIPKELSNIQTVGGNAAQQWDRFFRKLLAKNSVGELSCVNQKDATGDEQHCHGIGPSCC